MLHLIPASRAERSRSHISKMTMGLMLPPGSNHYKVTLLMVGLTSCQQASCEITYHICSTCSNNLLCTGPVSQTLGHYYTVIESRLHYCCLITLQFVFHNVSACSIFPQYYNISLVTDIINVLNIIFWVKPFKYLTLFPHGLAVFPCTTENGAVLILAQL